RSESDAGGATFVALVRRQRIRRCDGHGAWITGPGSLDSDHLGSSWLTDLAGLASSPASPTGSPPSPLRSGTKDRLKKDITACPCWLMPVVSSVASPHCGRLRERRSAVTSVV